MFRILPYISAYYPALFLVSAASSCPAMSSIQVTVPIVFWGRRPPSHEICSICKPGEKAGMATGCRSGQVCIWDLHKRSSGEVVVSVREGFCAITQESCALNFFSPSTSSYFSSSSSSSPFYSSSFSSPFYSSSFSSPFYSSSSFPFLLFDYPLVTAKTALVRLSQCCGVFGLCTQLVR